MEPERKWGSKRDGEGERGRTSGRKEEEEGSKKGKAVREGERGKRKKERDWERACEWGGGGANLNRWLKFYTFI